MKMPRGLPEAVVSPGGVGFDINCPELSAELKHKPLLWKGKHKEELRLFERS